MNTFINYSIILYSRQ